MRSFGGFSPFLAFPGCSHQNSCFTFCTSSLERWLLPVYSGDMGADIFSPGNRISRCLCSAETPPCPVGRRRPAPRLSDGAHGKEFTELERVDGRGAVTRKPGLCMWSSPRNRMRGSRCPWVSGSGRVRGGRGCKRSRWWLRRLWLGRL